MEQTTARLRKTFQYPADNDSDDSSPEALDEEEQENLIRTLKEQNTSFNILYTRILLALPLLSVIPYLSTLFNPLTSILSIFSISSLLSTAYLTFTLMPGRTGMPFLDALNNPSVKHSANDPRDVLHHVHPHPHGPIAEYLPLLNVGLCVVLGLLGMVFKGRQEVWWGFGWLPAGVYTVVLVAKMVMGSVDPEAELGGLRYGFKGA